MTSLPVDLDEWDGDRPRRLSRRTLDDIMSLLGSAIGSLALVFLLYQRILPVQGVLGFVLTWFVFFLAMYAAVSAAGNPWPVVADRLAAAVMHAGAVIVGFALLTTLVYTYYRAGPTLLHLNTYDRTMAGVRPTAPISQGGVLHAIVGSLIQVGLAVCFALPMGVWAAVFMTEVGGRFGKVLRTVIEAMTALPDILAGLFVYTVLILSLGLERSGFAAACALTVMMTPIIARSSDVVLRVVPGGLREASLALGATHWRTVWHVVLPTARPGLATALILGMARTFGETAPVLITSGASTFFNSNPFHHPMNSLPLFALSAVRSGEPVFIQRGFAAAGILLAMVLLLFVGARRLARQRSTRP